MHVNAVFQVCTLQKWIQFRLLNDFRLKKKTLGTSQSSNVEIKRNSALTPKKEDPSSASSGAGRRSISNSRNSNNTEDDDPRSSDRSMFMRRQKYGFVISQLCLPLSYRFSFSVTVSIETPMKVVESVADAFRCVTHGMIQNTADPMQKIIHRNPVVMHPHRQRTRHQQRQLQQQQQQQHLRHQHRQVRPLLQPQH